MKNAFEEFSKEISSELQTTKEMLESNENKMNDFRNKLIEEIEILKSKENKVEKTKEKKKFFSTTMTPSAPHSHSGICNSRSARIRRSLSK